MSEAEQALKEAIKAAGGGTELAKRLGIKQPSVAGWKQVPASRVWKVAAITGVAPERLRPDMFNEADPIKVAAE